MGLITNDSISQVITEVNELLEHAGHDNLEVMIYPDDKLWNQLYRVIDVMSKVKYLPEISLPDGIVCSIVCLLECLFQYVVCHSLGLPRLN